MKALKVALVHDDLVQWGGAERVLLGLSEIFPNAPIYTSLYDPSNKLISENFKDKDIRTSFLQKIPGSSILYRIFLPLYPIAFEQFDFSEYDLVISQTTRFAKAIITKPDTCHISYCHTPPRFLWNFSGENSYPLLNGLFSKLRIIDSIISKRVDIWVAGSKNAQKRIKKVYGVDSRVIYPFLKEDQKIAEIKEKDYFLIISRLNKYKKIDIAVRLFNRLGEKLIVIGKGPEEDRLKSLAKTNISFLKDLSEDKLNGYLANCKALIILAEEDFGLTALEAQGFGKPVVAYAQGGALETVKDGKTGVLFSAQSESSLEGAVHKLEDIEILSKDCIANSKRFSFQNFKKQWLGVVGLELEN